jgi:hypothetical protein
MGFIDSGFGKPDSGTVADATESEPYSNLGNWSRCRIRTIFRSSEPE